MIDDFGKYKFNLLKSPVDVRDWKVGSIFPRVTLPAEIDYRPMMFPVRDQGNSDACAAFAAAAMKEWEERVEYNIDEYLSPGFIYANREDKSSGGMYTRDLLKILKEKGVCFESQFPFGTSGMPSQDTYIYATKHRIDNFALINSIEEAKTALFLNGPTLIAFPVYNSSERFWYQYPGQSFLGGHLVTKVGYVKEGFVIRNSWSETWALGGYTIMPYEDFGLQWEAWSIIDAKSLDPTPPPVPDPIDPDEPDTDKKGCLGQFLWL